MKYYTILMMKRFYFLSAEHLNHIASTHEALLPENVGILLFLKCISSTPAILD